MIKFLRKLFIKNYDDVTNETVREKHGILASCIGIVFNALLFIGKLLVGVFTASSSVISDALNNMTDFGSSIVSLVGFKLSGKKADKDHPYGHERIEYISGLITSMIIIIIGVVLIYNSILNLISGTSNASFAYYSFIVLAASIILKIVLGLIYRSIGKTINSVSLSANMQDSFNDAISTTVVLVSSIIQFYFVDLWWLDNSISILVAFFIIFSGLKMVKETTSPLIGEKPDFELVKNIAKDIKNYDGVLGIHDLMVHSYGPTKTFVSCHVEVDGYKDTFMSHDLIDNIEKDISDKYKILLTIHMDPVDTRNSELPFISSIISKTLQNIDKNLSFHDLRIVKGDTHSNIIFDVVLPIEGKVDEEKITKFLNENIKKHNKDYNLVINFDQNYIM